MYTERTSHLELLSLLERKASLTVLLTPVASLIRVADHHILIPVGIKAGVDMESDVLLIWANIHCKTAAQSNKKTYCVLIWLLVFKMDKRTLSAQNNETVGGRGS